MAVNEARQMGTARNAAQLLLGLAILLATAPTVAAAGTPTPVPGSLIFRRGFESGNLSGWSDVR